ncbi:hypothetical protein LTR22_027403, partial [Elasticomyces elasticus]
LRANQPRTVHSVKMKSSFTTLPLSAAASALRLHSGLHHLHQPHAPALGPAPYDLSNSTGASCSSDVGAGPNQSDGQTINSTIVENVVASDLVAAPSALFSSASQNLAGAAATSASLCTPGTVTVTEIATVTITTSALNSATSLLISPTQAHIVASSNSLRVSITASAAEASSSAAVVTLTFSSSSAVNAAATYASASSIALVSSSSIVSAPAKSATAAASSAASSSGKSSKRGIIVSRDDTEAITAAFANSKVSWLGNWYSGPPPNLTPEMGMEFVPQMYHTNSDNDRSWTSNAKKAITADGKYFMGFGEPDTSGITPSVAVKAWMQYMEPYAAQGIKLGAPGNLQNPQDMDWLSSFMELCDTAGCTIGFVCVHWYWTPGSDGQGDFKHAVNNATALARGKPVWVENFGANGSAEEGIAFLTNIIPWLENNDAIESYGYVAINRSQAGFLSESGTGLSDIGKFYATF